MSIISSSPLREGILSQVQDLVIQFSSSNDFYCFISHFQDSPISRPINRQIDPIPEYEPDLVSHPLTQTPSSNNRRSPSPTRVNNNSTVPLISTNNKTSAKRSSNPTTPNANKTDDFVLIPEQTTSDKSLSSGNQTDIHRIDFR